MVGFGRTVPRGFLPVYTVDTEAEAHHLIVSTCKLNQEGDYFAPELAAKQSLERLIAFGERLAERHARIMFKDVDMVLRDLYVMAGNYCLKWGTEDDEDFGDTLESFKGWFKPDERTWDADNKVWHIARTETNRLAINCIFTNGQEWTEAVESQGELFSEGGSNG